ncbi:MAG: SLATT domain-containing protein [Cytophagales bacterium]|nr:MAG: SLATT domain-containing protein [Cytophagales bacterium]
MAENEDDEKPLDGRKDDNEEGSFFDNTDPQSQEEDPFEKFARHFPELQNENTSNEDDFMANNDDSSTGGGLSSAGKSARPYTIQNFIGLDNDYSNDEDETNQGSSTGGGLSSAGKSARPYTIQNFIGLDNDYSNDGGDDDNNDDDPFQSKYDDPSPSAATHSQEQTVQTPPPPVMNTADAIQNLLDMAQAGQFQSQAVTNQLARSKSDMIKLSERLFDHRKARKAITDPVILQEVKDKIAYLDGKIKEEMKAYDKRKGSASFYSMLLRFLTTAFAAAVTILLGTNVAGVIPADQIILGIFNGGQLNWFINFLALVMSALITVLSDIRGFFDTDELSIKFTDTSSKLKQLAGNIEYLKLGGDFITLEEVNLIKMEYDKIQEDTNEYVINIKAQDQNKDFSNMRMNR